jgi:hypothetical protein
MFVKIKISKGNNTINNKEQRNRSNLSLVQGSEHSKAKASQ